MTAMSKLYSVAVLMSLPAFTACKSKQSVDTAIVVEVTSDLVVPDEINQVRVTGTNPQGSVLYSHTFELGSGANRVSLPFRAGLYPLHDVSTPIHIEAVGHLGDTPVVSIGATLSFIQGKQIVLGLSLLAVCKPVKCTEAHTTCKASGSCEPDAVKSSDLPTYVPNQTIPGQDAAREVTEVRTSADSATTNLDTTSDHPQDVARDASVDTRPVLDVGIDRPVTSGTMVATGTRTGIESGTGTDRSTGTGTAIGTGTGTAGGNTNTASGTGTGIGTASGNTATATGTGTATGVGKQQGTSCESTGECQMGLTCLDGVCCTQASCPQCLNCSAEGTCSLKVSNVEDTTGTTCTGVNTCSEGGVCKRKSGESCTPGGGDCASGICLDNRCCNQSCGVCQTCTGAGGTCVAVTSADDVDTCTGANTCNAVGVCKKKSGESCTPTGGECASGTCRDNRCCIQSCGVCQACTGAGGTCVAVLNAEDPDTCGNGNTCDAAGVCKQKDGLACSSASECLTGNCNSRHLCGPAVPARCTGLAATCGPAGSGDCCSSLPVTGGKFYRDFDGVTFMDNSYPATVADFYLDKYLITVGRFRQFVDAGMGTQSSPPLEGTGTHPLIAGSGWNSAWNTSLAVSTAALKAAMKCDSTYQTWTDAAGANESQPINCLDWFTATAFCAWDGGRLPTDAEWNYAAAGGSEQRRYPWSSPPTSSAIDDTYAVYLSNSTQNVGAKSPKGDGRWGQADLTGNVSEWVLDWQLIPLRVPCDNCAYLAGSGIRVIRGGSFNLMASFQLVDLPGGEIPANHTYGLGARCARTRL